MYATQWCTVSCCLKHPLHSDQGNEGGRSNLLKHKETQDLKRISAGK